MAELQSKVKEYTGSFGQAFREASKSGAKKFKWRGNYYTTETAENKKAQSHSSVEKGNAKEKYGKSDGTVTNRYVIRNHGNQGFSVYDNEVGRYIGSLHKDKQSATKYLNSEQFKEDSGEVVTTAARTKLDRKTAGFQPVDANKNFQGKDGNTRLYQERGTGRYLVTDNYGNIVGYSFDPAAATADQNWGGWIAYTGSKDDLKAAGTGKLRDEANRNEVNQKSKQAKERMTDDWERQMDGIRRMQGGFNTVQGMLNMPNNIITGAIRAGISDNYSWDDYKDSFTIDGLWRGNSSVGLGDVLEIDNGYGRFAANLINPMSLMTLRGGTGKTTTKGKPYKSRGTTQNLDAHTVTVVEGKAADPTRMQMRYVGTEQPSLRGKYVGTVEGKGKMLPVSGNRSSQFSNLGRNQQVTSYENGMPRIQSNKNIRAEYPGVTMTRQQIQTTANPWRAEFFTPGIETTTYNPWMNIKPFNAAFRYDPKVTYVYSDETPTANFWYSGEGNPNTYAQGRIATGEAVSGTSGENWSGGQSGGTVIVDNTKSHVSPTFGGVTVGGGRDNQSSWYLPLAYKKGGKAKLVSRKSCKK